MNSDDKPPWYKKGLYFQCTSCGKCCTGAPGYVWLDQDDITNLARECGISEKEFIRKYTRFKHGRYSLLEDKKTFDCVFLKEKTSCQVYKNRPKQCRTFPFWKENLRSQETWTQLKRHCEGIDHEDGEFYSYEDIKKNLSS